MLSGKYIPIGEIISNLYRDKGYKYELPYSDCIEWAVDAIKLIGAPMALVNKQIAIGFDDGRVKLPHDFSELIQVAGSFGGSYPFAMIPSTGSFVPKKVTLDLQLTQDILSGTNIDLTEATPIGQDINGNPVYAVQENSIIFPKALANTQPISYFNQATYSINDNYIFTNFQVGYVFLSYRAIPIDCDGLPMIPDNQRYVEAIKAFLSWKIDYLLWRRGELSERIYRDSEAEWLWYVGSAGNAARMPDTAGMQSLLNQIKVLGNRYAYGRFFNNLGK
jgi:hypothetical protein